MKVVVTGGAGFIGSHVCEGLVRRGVAEVVAFDDLSTGSAANLAGTGVGLREGTILDRAAVAAVTKGASGVVHLAALPSVPRSLLDPLASHEANVTGTLHVLEAARSCGAHVVVASSSSVYGSEARLPNSEDTAPQPVSPYAVSKLAAESYTLAYTRSFGVPTLAVRLFNVFGPRQRADSAYAAVVPRFIQAAIAGAPLQVHGDGRQTRDFTFVGTVADRLCEAVVRRIVHDRSVNLAFGLRTSLLTIINLLGEILGRPLDVVHTASRSGDIRDSQAGTRTLRRLFPEAEPYDLREALTETVSWHVNRATEVHAAATPGDPEGRENPSVRISAPVPDLEPVGTRGVPGC
ncbi:NAD-dependent epimerase/dehydratase family protein [Frankia sp. R43]|uniref:NAD-dependent epimerase/dehydratase family protein n=1 Tax=Frankia sp. R43 TaxID=269536 RepID=UPI0007C6C4BF|nr:NAD-dependent epimerase/dehydratase family protein [Frankia sp. R43]